MHAVFELYFAANSQKIPDKKKVDYQEGLDKSRSDSVAQSRDSYMKNPEKICAQSRKSYMKDPEKCHTHSAAQIHENYEKDLEKSCWNETGLAKSYKSKKK